MPSVDAPAISFSEDEQKRLRELRQAFLRSQGVASRQNKQHEE